MACRLTPHLAISLDLPNPGKIGLEVKTVAACELCIPFCLAINTYKRMEVYSLKLVSHPQYAWVRQRSLSQQDRACV